MTEYIYFGALFVFMTFMYSLLMVHLRLVCSRQNDLRPRHATLPALDLAYERSEISAVEKYESHEQFFNYGS